jgi:formylglycine-generating enzyme required for sulfatase activity
MSELQYEKACRGKQAYFPSEYAWGNNFITAGNTFQGTENGTETLLTGNCIWNNITYTGGDAGSGPVRAGIFATSSVSSREQSGASYYGVMELTGNVFEWAVKAKSTSVFDRQRWGDGTLSSGVHDVTNWPSATATTDIIVRGGSWALTTDYLQVSDRRFSNQTAGVWNTGSLTTGVGGAYGPTLRTATTGGRGIR